MPASPAKLDEQFRRLGLYGNTDRDTAIRIALLEIAPDHYAGRLPPEKCAEEGFRGCEMFAFAWESRSRACRMYVKFVLKPAPTRDLPETLAIVSFHEEELS